MGSPRTCGRRSRGILGGTEPGGRGRYEEMRLGVGVEGWGYVSEQIKFPVLEFTF